MKQSIIQLKLLLLCCSMLTTLSAQEKLTKVSQSIKVDKDVTIDLNTSYCNIEFDTWNKNTVEIEAYIEGDDLSREALEKALENWVVEVDASTGSVTINTRDKAHGPWDHPFNHPDGEAVQAILEELKFELADLPEIDFDFNFEIPEIPEMPDVSPVPPMPPMPELPELPEGINNFQFDYQAYQKDGDKYLEEYTRQFESKFGKDFEMKMEIWEEKFGKEWEEEYAKQMEAWGEQFGEHYGKQMEAWGERFAEQMEQRAEQRLKLREEQKKAREKLKESRSEHEAEIMKERQKVREKLHEKRAKLADERRIKIERLVHGESHSKFKKTIRIKMPKGAQLKLNVKHGELKLATSINNLKADLSYTNFIAQSINGSRTSINATYSPVRVSHWDIGELNLNYVAHANLENVGQMVLNANSSNIKIDNLKGNAIINGSIGDLQILNIEDTFTNLNAILHNTNAVISLPKVGYSLQYKGDRTRFSHPQKLTKENDTSFSIGDLNTGKSIVINAKYSTVNMQ
ncbi:hypothetical protein [Aestuariivivens sediminis]|uniref:hypothetical protein n=1 Tax=Aestuariivivens sediminis TaxID=2913557 RepID=UPI001F58AAC1|nr:hypothetical protein [Aestuariivivens sediminis]